MLENFKLSDLADLDTENQEVSDYLFRAHRFWADLGISGFRLDTVRHVPAKTWIRFREYLQKQRPDLLFVGEWYGGGPGNDDSIEFVKTTELPIFDFQFRYALRELFLGKKDLSAFAGFLKESDASRNLVTFIDNHDLPRMQSEGATDADMLEMMKLLFALRGVPSVYYGLESFLHENKDGGKDPYNRESMIFPESSAPGFQMLQKLVALRKNHLVLRAGTTRILKSSPTELQLLREQKDSQFLVVIQSGSGQPAIPAGFKEVSLPKNPAGKATWKVTLYRKTP